MCPRKKCKAKFRSKEGLELHKKCHLEEGAYKCLECEQLHPHWKPMQWHLWLAHGVDVDLCKCHLCHYRAENWQKIDAHLESHEMEEEEEGGQAEDSEEHESPGDGKPPECDICGRSFSTAAALKGHVELVHKKERPFSCTFCEYTTGRKAALDLHLRTHTGEKPFKCDMCNYRASDHNSLRRHRMRHTGDRSYRCQLCPYTCIQSISLKMHMKNKHPGSQAMYACDLCPFHAVNKTSIDHHMEDHRRGLLIEGEETSEQISGPSASYTIEANDDCMNMISSNDVVFTIESSSDGKQYLVPSTLSAVGLTVSGQQAVQPHAEASDRDEVQMVLVEGQHQVTPDALQHLVTDVTGATTLQDI
ncbi:hypothetical protein CAPTEDRAFT_147046 [Capitella teleta]|uniref:C2H2-type domain-containing protein n=1 Tax=Capitella teleta TaxID=283909 RepID=R7UU39_CAPTE|nr:hypothetical protein CAPTEDRAFT_147046 [Capitella teleta]|eukprot:ELU06916.1 hypothetical protein CAPTEDRAFT_147046 [Capitella teleta]